MQKSSWRLFVVQATIVLAPLAYGTVHPLPVLIFTLAGFALFISMVYSSGFSTAYVKNDVLFVLGLLGIILGLFQLIPLPMAVLRVLSPGTAHLYGEHLAAAELPAITMHAIAVIPWSVERATVWLAALCAWYAVLQHELQNAEAARSLVRTMAWTGVALGTLGLLQYLTHAHGIYWIGLRRPQFYASLVNPNQAAGMLTLATCACLAMSSLTKRHWRALWGAAALLTAVSVVFSLSRGGIGVLVFALLLYGWHAAMRGGGQKVASSSLWGPLLLTAGIILFVGWIGSQEVLGELKTAADKSLNGRTGVWLLALQGFGRDFPIFGSGLGSFADVFPRYDTVNRSVLIASPENEYLIAFFEGGIVGLGLALTAAGVLLWRIRAAFATTKPKNLRMPMAAGLAALMLHMLIDFPLHLGGPALWILSAAAIVSRGQAAGAPERENREGFPSKERPNFAGE